MTHYKTVKYTDEAKSRLIKQTNQILKNGPFNEDQHLTPKVYLSLQLTPGSRILQNYNEIFQRETEI